MASFHFQLVCLVFQLWLLYLVTYEKFSTLVELEDKGQESVEKKFFLPARRRASRRSRWAFTSVFSSLDTRREKTAASSLLKFSSWDPGLSSTKASIKGSHCGFEIYRQNIFCRLAAAEQAYQARSAAEGQSHRQAQWEMKRLRLRRSGGHPRGAEPNSNSTGHGPSSLFLLSERNILRRTTKFLIGNHNIWKLLQMSRFQKLAKMDHFNELLATQSWMKLFPVIFQNCVHGLFLTLSTF